jgi:acyl-CoA reductase-like NAD-dependent aldehyde dehydrogenase
MTTKTIEDLQGRIEQLVREHLAAQRKAAAAAVERAFSAAAAPSRPRSSGRGGWRRRPPTEMAALAERLYEAVRAKPGETMTVIAAHVGQTPLALSRPMALLKKSGRVRSAGQRHLTRYFPMAATSAKAA